MTATMWIGVASLVGAALFFAAGAALSALRYAARPAPRSAIPVATPEPASASPASPPARDPAELAELSRLRADERARAAEVERLRDELAATQALLRTQQAQLEQQATVVRREATPSPTPRAAEPDAELIAMRERATKLQRELDASRQDAITSARDLELAQDRLRDAERELAGKTQSVRDLSTENEQLKGRLRDAEALRADYVRLRTSVTEAGYLKSEVARLEKELRALRADALGPRSPIPAARGTVAGPSRAPSRPPRATTLAPERSISEGLTQVLEKLADAGTRSLVIGDAQGFPLASSGADGVALAAYAALLIESASRADDFLPVATPTAIEVRDDRGVCVSVWAFDVEAERLLLANLAVTPADVARVDVALAELTSILAPSRAASGSVG